MGSDAQHTSILLDRRRFLALGAAGGAFAAIGPANAQGKTAFRIQYDWLMDNGKLGDIVALHKGFFSAEGLDVTVSPGGPNAQTAPPVLANQAQAGQMGSAQVLAGYGEGLPITMFATTYQHAPLVFVSLPRAPVRSAKDFIGKKVAVTPNGRWLLKLMLTVNGIDEKQVELVTAGADLSPLLLGQADVGLGFTTNTKALSVLGPEAILLSARDAGGDRQPQAMRRPFLLLEEGPAGIDQHAAAASASLSTSAGISPQKQEVPRWWRQRTSGKWRRAASIKASPRCSSTCVVWRTKRR